jgi:hypothetical protein
MWLASVVVGCCLLAFGIAETKRPWVDEAWFASIAYNLIHKGVMGMTVLDPHGFIFAPLVPEVDRYTFWVMPGYPFLQAVWFKLFGLSVFTMRALSVAWVPVALISWFYIVSRVTNSRIVALLATVVLAADQHFIVSGSTGRMDMMGAAMSLLGPALYLRLRARFHRAIFTACAILAAGVMTHPNAIFGGLLLLLIVLWWDREKIRWHTVAIAAAPFVVLGGLWSLYVLQAPGIFMDQMSAQSKVPHRFVFDWNLFEQYRGELLRRYVPAYRLRSHSIPVKISGLPVIVYFASVIALGVFGSIRRHPGGSLIFALVAVQFTLLSCLQDNAYYLVYVLPGFSAAVGLCAKWLCDQGRASRIAATLTVASCILLNTGVIGYRIYHNDYANRYSRAVSYLKAHASPDALIVGSAELAFDFGFDGQVLDDCRLGYTSGRRPEFIVLDAFYYVYWIPYLAVHEPETNEYIQKLLKEDYYKVYDQSGDAFRSRGTFDLPYLIYRRIGAD